MNCVWGWTCDAWKPSSKTNTALASYSNSNTFQCFISTTLDGSEVQMLWKHAWRIKKWISICRFSWMQVKQWSEKKIMQTYFDDIFTVYDLLGKCSGNAICGKRRENCEASFFYKKLIKLMQTKRREIDCCNEIQKQVETRFCWSENFQGSLKLISRFF